MCGCGNCEARTPVCVGLGEQFHHRMLRSQGGDNSPENGLLVCMECHTYIHANPLLSYSEGWVIRGNSTTGADALSQKETRV